MKYNILIAIQTKDDRIDNCTNSFIEKHISFHMFRGELPTSQHSLFAIIRKEAVSTLIGNKIHNPLEEIKNENE